MKDIEKLESSFIGIIRESIRVGIAVIIIIFILMVCCELAKATTYIMDDGVVEVTTNDSKVIDCRLLNYSDDVIGCIIAANE